MQRIFAVLIAGVVAAAFMMPGPALAQQRTTLFDLLFGRKPAQPQQVQPPQQQTRPTTRAPAPKAALPPPKPKVDKAEGAKRLGVFGDSLAIDLSKGLERYYADDPNLAVVNMAVGSSGFVRDDFFDWNKALADAIAKDRFDLAVVMIGINDRQPIREGGQTLKPLTDAWKTAYSNRISRFLEQLRAAGKPVVWVGLPPMQAPTYSAAISQISSVQQLAALSGGAQFVDIYDRFASDSGGYASYGPDINGKTALMRKSDGIHFATAGADKLAFYVGQALKTYYQGGTVNFAVADPLADTDAQAMVRLPYQGLGQIRHLEIAGPVIPLEQGPRKADTLVSAGAGGTGGGFTLDKLVNAPVGRADAFGAGIDPNAQTDTPPPAGPAAARQ